MATKAAREEGHELCSGPCVEQVAEASREEEFRDTVAEAGLEVAELALLVLEGAECGDARARGVVFRVSELKARVDNLVEQWPEGGVRRVQAMVVRLANQVSRAGGPKGWSVFVLDEDSDEGTKTPQGEREAKKDELTALFSRKAPEGSQIANGVW